MLVLLTYIGLGVGLASIGLCIPDLSRKIDESAACLGMKIDYGRAVWLFGTVIAWPVGLYVLVTGRLILVEKDRRNTAGDMSMQVKP
ncbi:MAG: hypothetical protein AAGA21_03685 [Pseudomonadota bacterium]